MIFHFIYVEDKKEDRRRMSDAVTRHNLSSNSVKLEMTVAKSPEDLNDLLNKNIDLVLADVNFPLHGEQVNRLDDIIHTVQAWVASDATHSPIPIISYTSYGESTLNACLKRKESLFDIWDKGSAFPTYVTWRLSSLAFDLSRLRPDTFLHRLIQQMASGATWHNLVTGMPTSYNIGKTEYGQIYSVKSDIDSIAQKLNIYQFAKEMLEVMIGWEKLSRGVSPKVRGHARHVVNVFWMGYYIIHHELLRGWFADRWRDTLQRRLDDLKRVDAGNAEEAKQIQERSKSISEVLRKGAFSESLSNAWFMAGLFHDAAACVPNYPQLREVGDKLVQKFGCVTEAVPSNWVAPAFESNGKALFREMDDVLGLTLAPLWEESRNARYPDHGVVAALQLRKRVREPLQIANACEAALAIAVHNLIGELKDEGTQPLLNWDREPLICLLILCDQIQTWDRERGDESFFGPDHPSIAHLVALDVKQGTKPKIEMTIDYIVPEHLGHSPLLYEKVRRELESVIRERPIRALARIASDWPFELDVQCSLSGLSLAQGIQFGGA